MGILFVVGIGPGNAACLTEAARRALDACDVIIGYARYTELIAPLYPDKQVIASGMRHEIERCLLALKTAAEGQTAALVCSGDPGIYGMAGLVYELSAQYVFDADIEIIPGITAASAGAALLGAPLMNDFAVISLSNLLTPQHDIDMRLTHAAQGGLCICLYNAASRTRPDALKHACGILSAYRSQQTVCGIARNIGRDGQSVRLVSLAELYNERLDMFCTVFIGNDATKRIHTRSGDKMFTRRGYNTELAVSAQTAADKSAVIVFAGTSDGETLINRLKQTYTVYISVATEYGERIFRKKYPDCILLTGRRDSSAIAELLREKHVQVVIDATHPYAQKAHRDISCAAELAGVPYYRLVREQTSAYAADDNAVHVVSSIAEACACVSAIDGNIFIASGSNAVHEYTALRGFPERVFIRVLPSAQIIEKCVRAGFSPDHIIAMQGVFSAELNAALFRQYQIRGLITKDSGNAGGFAEKMQAARQCDVIPVVISRPPEHTAQNGYSEAALIELLTGKR